MPLCKTQGPKRKDFLILPRNSNSCIFPSGSKPLIVSQKHILFSIAEDFQEKKLESTKCTEFSSYYKKYTNQAKRQHRK
jgi:hypothetical protein